MLHHFLAIISGAIFIFGVIAGIGPQNLNIISHAIKRNHSLTVSTVSCLSNLVLLIAGGFGLSLSNSSALILIINIIGIIFMLWYLLVKINGLFKHHAQVKFTGEWQSKNQAILKAFLLSWLNPLVFIDTVVIIGGTASHYKGVAWSDFMCGAILSYILWIFGITFVAQSFSKQLNRTMVWIALDIMTIAIMLIILYKTIRYVI